MDMATRLKLAELIKRDVEQLREKAEGERLDTGFLALAAC